MVPNQPTTDQTTSSSLSHLLRPACHSLWRSVAHGLVQDHVVDLQFLQCPVHLFGAATAEYLVHLPCPLPVATSGERFRWGDASRIQRMGQVEWLGALRESVTGMGSGGATQMDSNRQAGQKSEYEMIQL